MTTRHYANAPATTLASGVTAGATTLPLASVTGLPTQYPFVLILDRSASAEEIVSVTNVSGLNATVTRGFDSSTAFAHSAGASVEHGVSAIEFREANTHVNATAGVHGVTGDAVGTTDSQALSNKDLSSATNTYPSTLLTTSGSQTVTNKNLTSPTNTFPSTLETVTGSQAKVDTHNAVTSPHSATSAATASRLVLRDVNGRAKVADPAVAADIATKGYVDAARPFRSFSKTTTGGIPANQLTGIGGWVGSNGDPGNSIGITLGGDGLLTVSEKGFYVAYLKLGYEGHTGGIVRAALQPSTGDISTSGDEDETTFTTVECSWGGVLDNGDTLTLAGVHNVGTSLGFNGTLGLNTAYIYMAFPVA